MPLPDAAVLVAGGAAALPSTARFAPAVPDGRRAGSDGPAWRGAWQRIERAFDAVFGAAANPLRHLGALGFFFFWWLVGSGIYLFAALDTSVVAAHASIADLAQRPWYAGGWLRSVHRYAADGFVVVLLLHLVREWLLGRYRGVRRYAWWTGIPLLLFAFASGIGGFWLHWDQLGQYSAQATAEWLDALPLAGARVAHNFAATAAVGDRLFSLFIFVHVGVALLMLFGLWFHVRRIAHADVFPPARLALATTLGLLALAAVAPVTSHPPADLSHAPGALRLDWFLLFVHPLVERTSPEVGWALVVAALLTLFLLPLLPRGRAAPATAPPAEVDPANCNGCGRCFVDCPFTAITMVPRPHPEGATATLRELAEVDGDLCASCGICVGACPSSTPFRSGETLVTGIDLPQRPVDALRRELDAALAERRGRPSFVVVGCAEEGIGATAAASDVVALELVCTGQLPPSFIDYALRSGADGVVVTGCREGDCAYRLGQRWSEERLAGARAPGLRAGVAREALRIAWPRAGEPMAVARALDELRRHFDAAAADRGATDHA